MSGNLKLGSSEAQGFGNVGKCLVVVVVRGPPVGVWPRSQSVAFVGEWASLWVVAGHGLLDGSSALFSLWGSPQAQLSVIQAVASTLVVRAREWRPMG